MTHTHTHSPSSNQKKYKLLLFSLHVCKWCWGSDLVLGCAKHTLYHWSTLPDCSVLFKFIFLLVFLSAYLTYDLLERISK